MFDPFSERAFDTHSVELARALPAKLTNRQSRLLSQTRTVPAGGDNSLLHRPDEFNGLRALRKTPRKD